MALSTLRVLLARSSHPGLQRALSERALSSLASSSCLRRETRRTIAASPTSLWYGNFPSTLVWRGLSTDVSSLVSKDNIVRSPYPDEDIPVEPFHSLMFRRCDEHRDKVALVDYLTGKSYTYLDVKETAMKVASGLHKLGFRKGDVLLAYASNCCDYSILMLACSCVGVWYSAANPGLTAEELARQVEHSNCVGVIVSPGLEDNLHKALASKEFTNKVKHHLVFGESKGFKSFQDLLDNDGTALPQVDIDPKEDVYILPYSSGTTGFPKGVMLTHYNCAANLQQIVSGILMTKEDVVLGLLPVYHIYGMIVVQFASMYQGATLIMLPRFEPEMLLQCLQDKKITFAPLVPPLVLFLAKHPLADKYDLSSLSDIVSGAAPLGQELTQEFLTKYPKVKSLNQGYGLTEMSPVTHLDCSNNPGSIGVLIANTLGRIVDSETGQTLEPGEDGELVISGPQVMKGYYKNQKATDDMVKDGWLHTGDIASVDKQGQFYIKDRIKELIKYKGSQVAPAELEAVILGHPDVQDVAVIGIPDEAAGELPKAFVVKKPDAAVTEDDISKFVEGKVSKTKRLRGGVMFIDAVPKVASGKILRRVLKDKYVKK